MKTCVGLHPIINVFVLIPFLVRSRLSCDKGAFQACPCTSPPHKGIWAFVCVFCVFLVRLVVLWRGDRFGRAHAPPLLIKAFGLPCLCSRPLPCAFGRLVMRGSFRAFRLSCLCSSPLPCVVGLGSKRMSCNWACRPATNAALSPDSEIEHTGSQEQQKGAEQRRGEVKPLRLQKTESRLLPQANRPIHRTPDAIMPRNRLSS